MPIPTELRLSQGQAVPGSKAMLFTPRSHPDKEPRLQPGAGWFEPWVVVELCSLLDTCTLAWKGGRKCFSVRHEEQTFPQCPTHEPPHLLPPALAALWVEEERFVLGKAKMSLMWWNDWSVILFNNMSYRKLYKKLSIESWKLKKKKKDMKKKKPPLSNPQNPGVYQNSCTIIHFYDVQGMECYTARQVYKTMH